MSYKKQVTAVSAEVPADLVDALLDALAASTLSPTAWEDLEQRHCRIEFFADTPGEAADAIAALRQVGSAFGLSLEPHVEQLAPEEWSESWKRYFHVQKVSPRLIVRPVWEPYQAADDELVIDMEPGLSFGTGQHGTTSACLRLLDQISAAGTAGSMLDMGCGSGILSIAAAKLGFKPVSGFDNDPDAVTTARNNAAANGVEVEFYLAELASCKSRADVVAANILATVLINNAALIAAAVNDNPQAALIVSGILETEYDEVLRTFSQHGFTERESITVEVWRSGWLCRGQL